MGAVFCCGQTPAHNRAGQSLYRRLPTVGSRLPVTPAFAFRPGRALIGCIRMCRFLPFLSLGAALLLLRRALLLAYLLLLPLGLLALDALPLCCFGLATPLFLLLRFVLPALHVILPCQFPLLAHLLGLLFCLLTLGVLCPGLLCLLTLLVTLVLLLSLLGFVLSALHVMLPCQFPLLAHLFGLL